MSLSNQRPRSIAIAAFAVVLAVAACGGSGTTASTAPDTATPEPTIDATPTASASPTPARPEISGAPALVVALETQDESDVRVSVIDQTGHLSGVTSGTPGDGASVAVDAPTVEDGDATSLVVTWAASPCDSEPTVVLSDANLLIVQPPCPDPTDAVAFDRVLILRLSDTIEAASLPVVIRDHV